MTEKSLEMFLNMLTYKRPHDSATEQLFTATFLDPIPGMETDEFGNRHIQIGEHPETLFSAHVDTVHTKDGMQKVVYDTASNYIYKDDNDPLGADNAAGVICLMHLIANDVPGYYVFHRGEECGGLGSRWLLKEFPEAFAKYKRAVAFDRRDTCSIITYQRGRRCASDDFASALSAMVKDFQLDLKADTGGSFTDTATYMDVIPECTNISVGYLSEHTSSETQDMTYLETLLNALPQIKWDELPAKRDPSKKEYRQSSYTSKYSSSYSSSNNVFNYYGGNSGSYGKSDPATYAEVYEFVFNNPLAAVDLLYDMDLDLQEYLTYKQLTSMTR